MTITHREPLDIDLARKETITKKFFCYSFYYFPLKIKRNQIKH